MDLPKGHWIHGAMAKEKARVGKKGGKANAPSKTATKKSGKEPMGNGQPAIVPANMSNQGCGPADEHQNGGAKLW